MPDPHPVVTFDHVTVAHGAFVAVREVSLELRAGSVTYILGNSGSGKSTLAKLIVGLMEPSEGRIQVLGHDTPSDLPAAELASLRRRVAMVFQHNALLEDFDAVENVKFPLLYGESSLPSREVERLARDVLTQLGLEEQMHQSVLKLSGGQRRRVALARALVLDPELIIYDEPTTGLDPAAVASVFDMVTRTNEKSPDRSSLVITHDVHALLSLGSDNDDVVVLEDGQLRLKDGQLEPGLWPVELPAFRQALDQGEMTDLFPGVVAIETGSP